MYVYKIEKMTMLKFAQQNIFQKYIYAKDYITFQC